MNTQEPEQLIETAVANCEDDNPFYGDVLAAVIEQLDMRYERQ